MRWLIDLLYGIAAIIASPIWLTRMIRTGKIRTDWAGRLGQTQPLPAKTSPRVLFHAVSVGEVNAIRMLVDAISQPVPVDEKSESGGVQVIIATTTDTGFARAKALWGGCHHVVRYPLDFSFSVAKFLNAIRPDVAVLVELEVWPNFTAACTRRSIPVMVVNGRLTERSFRRYQQIRRLVAPMFSRLAFVATQNQAYSDRFQALGVSQDRIRITGTMKWDTAQIAHGVDGAEALRNEMGIDPSKPLVVAGSTAPDEHKLLLRAVPVDAQLLCAPRKPEWFDQAAMYLPGCVRRSETRGRNGTHDLKQYANSDPRLFLLDTIGELRQAYCLADVVVIGRSFGELHGSDMMEPIALGKATIVGPAVADFQDTVDALLAGDGLIQTSADGLADAIANLLRDSERRALLAANGQKVIRSMQGATERNAALIREVLGRRLAK